MSTLRVTVQTEDVIHCFVAVIQLEFRNINLYSKTSEVKVGGESYRKNTEIISSVKFYLDWRNISPSPL